MAINHFHLRDGADVLLDPEGCEQADHAAAEEQALIAARSILSAEALEGRLAPDVRIDVESHVGALVHRLPFAQAIEIIPPDSGAEDQRQS